MGVQALVLGLLTVTGEVRLWQVGVLAALLGLNNAFENPARQSFMLEMVGRDSLRTAVSLNSTMVNLARVVGPAIGGVLIATTGVGRLLPDQRRQLPRRHLDARAPRPLRDHAEPAARPRARASCARGCATSPARRSSAIPLLMMALAGVFAFEFQVTLPVLAKQALDQGSEGFGLMTAAMGVGAVGGGLLVAARGQDRACAR